MFGVSQNGDDGHSPHGALHESSERRSTVIETNRTSRIFDLPPGIYFCRSTRSTLRMCARACARRACCPVMISMKTIIGFEFPGRRLGGRETGDVDSLLAHGH